MEEMLSGHTFVAGRPPKIPMAHSKRHSLQCGDTITNFNKLKKISSQPKLRKDVLGGSLASLNLDSSKKYSSLVQLQSLKATEKTLSASNLAAISDSNLSLKEAMPPRSYDQPNSSYSEMKSNFEDLVKCYYHQLTKGCGKDKCKNKFCFSSKDGVKFASDVAGIISIELATRNKQYLCISHDRRITPLPWELFRVKNNKAKPFLHCLFSTTPFQALFQPGSHRRNSEKNVNLMAHSTEVRKRVENRQGSISNNDARLEPKKHEQISNDNSCGGSNEKANGKGLISQPSSVRVEPKGNIFSLDTDFSKSNLSGNLMHDLSLPGMPPELFSSNSSLNDAVDLEEFEKECALEMSTGHVQEFSLTHLTLPMLKSSVANYNECRDPAFLINTIRTVFTSPEALNESFRVVSNDGYNYLDTPSVRKAYKLLLNLEPKDTFVQPLLNALEIHLAAMGSMVINSDDVAQLVIILENPLVQESQALLRRFCQGLSKLPADSRRALIDILIYYDTDPFKHLLQVLHTYLSSLVSPGQCSNPHLLEVCECLAIFYDTCDRVKKKRRLELVPVADFYNEDLSLKLDFKKEYEYWRTFHETASCSKDQKMSLLDYPFLLDPASKVRVLHIDAVWQMRVEYQNAIVHQARVQQAQRLWEEVEKENNLEDAVKSAMCPFLVLEVRRDHLIQDTLNQIYLKEFDLKKPLKIKYVGWGEQGLDMGGLQKEFFHMIVEAVFDPGYGMFTYVKESRSVWINSSSLESEKEFELVGILLGLAIYNGIILDVHFPVVIYKKLQGEKLDLQDLMSIQPSLAKSLRELLEFEGDVEDIFCYTFQVSSSEFDNVQSVELVPNGKHISVTNSNRELFVSLYVDHLLVKSIERQFSAFSQGFHKVCGGRALTLFRPDELELLICGCPVIDFYELELAATYEEGYDHNHPTIVNLWKVVREMTLEQKKAFLMFVTGSDRVPLKGLVNLTFIIQSHGPDSERLPSALTCFNRLLLPQYSGREKLKERLVVAIENCQGFGLT